MDQQLYKVVEILGKGQGCVAMEEIKKGALILQEKSQIVDKTDQSMDVGHYGSFWKNEKN